MLKFLRRLIDRPSPADGLQESHEILIRCARRCAYDLQHAVSFIPAKHTRVAERLQVKADWWIDLFSSGNSVKDYRLQLHRELDERDVTIAALRAALQKHGVEDPTQPIPF